MYIYVFFIYFCIPKNITWLPLNYCCHTHYFDSKHFVAEIVRNFAYLLSNPHSSAPGWNQKIAHDNLTVLTLVLEHGPCTMGL